MINPNNKIPEDYFDKIMEWPATGATLEKLAKYGDPREFRPTIPLFGQKSGNFSFVGLQTAIKKIMFER